MQGTAAIEEDTGYQIEKSIRLNDNDSANLNRTVDADGNRRVWTLSMWAKMTSPDGNETLFGDDGGSPNIYCYLLDSSGSYRMRFAGTDGSGNDAFYLESKTSFRDPAAWYHFIFAIDTTQATNTNRIKVYCNGEELSWVSGSAGSLSIPHYPDQNEELTAWNSDGAKERFGQFSGGSFFDGYLADIQFIDGLQLSQTAFGEFDDAGTWKAKELTLPASTAFGDPPNARSNPNAGIPYSDLSEDAGARTGGSWAQLFNGNLSNGVDIGQSSDTWGVAFDNLNIPCTTSIGTWTYTGSSTPKLKVTSTSGNVSTFDGVSNNQWTDWAYTHGNIKKIELGYIAGSGSNNTFLALRIDGHTLVDSIVDNTYHLKFNDTSSNAALGYSSLATGLESDDSRAINGAPIEKSNRNGSQRAAGTYRTDDNASSLVLALPLTQAWGVNDAHGSVTGGSNLTCDAESSANSTSEWKWDGSSRYFGSGDYIDYNDSSLVIGTGDYTVECWCYWDDAYSGGGAQNRNYLWDMQQSGVSSAHCYQRIFLDGTGGSTVSIYTMDDDGTDASLLVWNAFPKNQWVHVAQVRSSGTIKTYMNGIERHSHTFTNNINAGQFNIGGTEHGGFGSWSGYITNFKVYTSAVYTGSFTPVRVPDDFDVSNLTAANDVVNDSPTDYESGGTVHGNFCTMNPLNETSGITLSEANLRITGTGSAYGTFLMPRSGKYYWEVTANSAAYIGIDNRPFGGSSYVHYNPNGQKQVGGGYTSSYGSSFTSGDVIGVAVDMTSQSITFYKNNTGQGAITFSSVSLTDKDIVPLVYSDNSAEILTNFGAKSFAHTPPSGYKALCTQNLPDLFSGDALNNPSKYFDIKTYSGTGSSQNITGLSFEPDFVWIKERNGTRSHILFDRIRGVGKSLRSEGNYAELNDPNSLTAFNSDGFTVGTEDRANNSSKTYVGWCWDAGTSAATVNTDGGIDPTHSWVNATAGFNIIRYQGNGSNSTVGHNLGAKPHFRITKWYSNSTVANENWSVYHHKMGAGSMMNLDLTDAKGTSSVFFNNTEPTNTVFTVGTHNSVNEDDTYFISYNWTAIPGFSKFGHYVGTGSSTNFIYLGFQPRWFLLKPDAGDAWRMFDAERNAQTNPVNTQLQAQATNAELAANDYKMHFNSNGIELQASLNSGINGSGTNFYYAAFAEHPFKTARAN